MENKKAPGKKGSPDFFFQKKGSLKPHFLVVSPRYFHRNFDILNDGPTVVISLYDVFLIKNFQVMVMPQQTMSSDGPGRVKSMDASV